LKKKENEAVYNALDSEKLLPTRSHMLIFLSYMQILASTLDKKQTTHVTKI